MVTALGLIGRAPRQQVPMFEAIEAYSHQVLEFIRLHQAWAPPIVMLLAFGESLAFISLLLPAWAALVGMGALISAGEINFWPIWAAAAIGAALGDWLSFWIGRKLEFAVQQIWPLSRHPELITMGVAFMVEWRAAGS